MPSLTKKRPMAKVRRVSLISRQVVERLGRAGADLALARASRMSEGQVLADDKYFGSTMLTIDLRQLVAAREIGDPCDLSTASRVARLMTCSEDLRRRVREIAQSEACRLAGRAIDAKAVDVGVRAEGAQIFIDIDFEGSAVRGAIETVG